MINKYIIILLLLNLNLSVIAKQNLDTFRIDNLDILWKLAIENNSSQKVYQLKIQQTQVDYNASRAYLLPQISASFSGQDNTKLATTPVPGELLGQPNTTQYLQFGKQFVYNTGVSISKSLFDWQAKAQSNIAKENIALNTAQKLANEQNLKTHIAQSYFTLLITKKAIEISESDFKIADNILLITMQKFQQGLTDAIAVNQAKMNNNNILISISQSKELYKNALASIKILSGMSEHTYVDLKPIDKIESLYKAYVTTVNQDKNVLVYSHNVEIQKWQHKFSKAAILPKFSINSYYGYQQFRDNFRLDFKSNSWKDYRYVSINMSVPIFTGFSNRNKLKSNNIQTEIVKLQNNAAIEQSNINNKSLQETIDNYLSITNISKNNFELYGKNLELNLQKFKEGIISLDIYLKAFEDYIRSENTYLNNLSTLLYNQAIVISRK
jgi:outer membrane protein